MCIFEVEGLPQLEHLGPGARVSFARVDPRVAPVHHQEPQLQHARLGIPVELKLSVIKLSFCLGDVMINSNTINPL